MSNPERKHSVRKMMNNPWLLLALGVGIPFISYTPWWFRAPGGNERTWIGINREAGWMAGRCMSGRIQPREFPGMARAWKR